MKLRPVILSIILFLICSTILSQPKLTNSPPHQFTSSWKQVDSLSNIGLPKSALAIVNRIYDQAKKEKNDPQYIKAVLYRLKLKADYREDAATSSIREIKSEIKGSQEPARQILNSILAEIYQSYYQNNRYRFQDRTQVLNNTSDSIQTWDLKTLTKKTSDTWLLSLKNAAILKSIPIGNFEDILVNRESQGKRKTTEGSVQNKSYRPTLYDFLAWRALQYFSGSESPDKASANVFYLDKPDYFKQAAEFSGMKLELPTDSSSFLAFAIKTYQDLTAFHLNDKDPRALIDEEIQRFLFLKERSVVPGKDSLYLESLEKLEQTYSSSSYSTDVTYAIATFLKEQGSQYQPLDSQKHKWDLKEAVDNCNQAVKRFPESTGANNCKLLAAEIAQPSFRIQTEYAVILQKPSLALLEFKNLKTLWFRLAKTDPDVNQQNTVNRSREELIGYYSSLPFQKNWKQDIPNDGDYQSHRMEINVPGLPAGFYVLIASSDPNFKDAGQVIAWAPFFSTQISYISQRNEKNEEEFYILDRETGSPLKNVNAVAFQNSYNYTTRKYENQKIGEYVTDENGHFSLPAVLQGASYNNEFLRLKMNDDLFITGNYYRYPLNTPNEKPELKTFFFIDRGIYRPGQTVYFKGILLEKSLDNYSIKPAIITTTVFTDANNQKISELTFTTNEFGSFNGSFVIPQGLLTGTMTLSNGTGSVSFAVEEYKRPTFEVSFDPTEGNYRLNDSVTVRGKAIAYAGNNLDGAAVKFRVVRSARFPFWDEYWRPISIGTGNRDPAGQSENLAPKGAFTVKFLAIPDLSIDKSTKPTFDYVVYTDVTDINGETQSATQSVSAGYTFPADRPGPPV
jgi:hypothetical protein